MKILFIFLVCLWFVQGCTRAAKTENTKIQIQLPEAITAKNVPVNTKISDPNQVSEINCYVVAVSGPDNGMQRNTCKVGPPRTGTNSSGPTIVNSEMHFGDWSGGHYAGNNISIEITSGQDRVVRLIGMKVDTPEACNDFKAHGVPSEDKSSNAFVLGEAGHLNLNPGETVSVPIEMRLDTQKSILGCSGQDAPVGNNSGGGSGGGGSSGPYLRFEGIGRYNSGTDRDIATVDECYLVKPALFIGTGSPWVDPAGNDIHVDVTNVTYGNFYISPSCGGGAVTDLVIEAGTNRSLGNYYFKPFAAVNDVSMASTTLSGNSLAVANNQQFFNFGARKIVITGPNRVVLNQCYEYALSRRRFEGDLITDSTTASGSISDMANFYFRTGATCASGSSVNFASGQGTVLVYFKLVSVVTVSLDPYVNVSGFSVAPFAVDSSSLGEHQDSLEVIVPENKLVRGECQNLSLRVLNKDGGVVKPKQLIYARVKVPQGAGTFHDTADCSSTATDLVNIPVDSTHKIISFRAHSVPAAMLVAGKLSLTIDAGALHVRGIGPEGLSAIQIPVVDALGSSPLAVVAPSFNGAEIVGDHEFADGGSPSTYKYISLMGRYSELIDVECSATPSTGYSTCLASEVDRSTTPFRYKWDAGNASANTSRYVRFVYPGYSKEVAIGPQALYGPNFKVVHCDSVAASGTGIPIAALATGVPVVCLPANSEWAKSAVGVGHSLSASHRGIIGHSSGSSSLNANGYTGGIVEIASMSMTSDYFVANITFTNIPANDYAVKISGVSSSGVNTIHVNNARSIVSTNSAKVINMLGQYDLNVRTVIRNSTFDLPGYDTRGVDMTNTSEVTMEDIIINHSGSAGYGVIVYNSSTGGDNIRLRYSTINVTAGTAFKFYNGAGVPTYSGNEIVGSRMKRASAGSGSSPVVYLEGKNNLMLLDGNIFTVENQPNQALLSVVGISSLTPSYRVQGNTFLQSEAGAPAIYTSSFNISFSEFSKNSIAYTGTAAPNTMGALYVDSGATVDTVTSLSSAYGGNLICSVGSNNFSVPFTNNGSMGGNFTLASSPLLANNLEVTSGRCAGN